MKKISIFASGAGSNALNLMEKSLSLPDLEISSLIVDTESSPLPEIVKNKYPHIKIAVILPNPSLKGAMRKSEHEERILEVLKANGVEWILLAGYMRILGCALLGAYSNRIINIHPSLLPLYPGVDSYRRAFEDGVAESGVTVHLVDEGVDTGPVILQERFPRLANDTLADFVQRGKEVEWRIYPRVLEMIHQSAQLVPGV